MGRGTAGTGSVPVWVYRCFGLEKWWKKQVGSGYWFKDSLQVCQVVSRQQSKRRMIEEVSVFLTIYPMKQVRGELCTRGQEAHCRVGAATWHGAAGLPHRSISYLTPNMGLKTSRIPEKPLGFDFFRLPGVHEVDRWQDYGPLDLSCGRGLSQELRMRCDVSWAKMGAFWGFANESALGVVVFVCLIKCPIFS